MNINVCKCRTVPAGHHLAALTEGVRLIRGVSDAFDVPEGVYEIKYRHENEDGSVEFYLQKLSHEA